MSFVRLDVLSYVGYRDNGEMRGIEQDGRPLCLKWGNHIGRGNGQTHFTEHSYGLSYSGTTS